MADDRDTPPGVARTPARREAAHEIEDDQDPGQVGAERSQLAEELLDRFKRQAPDKAQQAAFRADLLVALERIARESEKANRSEALRRSKRRQARSKNTPPIQNFDANSEEKAQNAGVKPPVIQPRPPEGFITPEARFKRYTELLAEDGIPEQARPALAGKFMQQADEVRAMTVTQPATGQSQAATATDPQTWQGRVAPHPEGAPVSSQPEGAAPKKRGRPPRTPPTSDEIRDAKNLLWRVNVKGEPVKSAELKKARRDARWAERHLDDQKVGSQTVG